MNLQEKKEKMYDLFLAFYMSLKFSNPTLEFKIIESDVGIYDAYEYPTPFCYSIKIKSYDKYFVKGSINIDDGECVLEIKDCSETKGNYIKKIYEERKKLRSSSFHYSLYNDYTFLGYFEDSDYFFKVFEGFIKA